MAEVKVDLSGFQGDIKKLVARLEPAARAALIEALAAAYNIDLNEMSELIYNKPETEVMRRNRKTGRVRRVKLWKRKSNLLRGERMELPTKGNLRGRIYNNREYAETRHNLQYPAKTMVTTVNASQDLVVLKSGRNKGKYKRTKVTYRYSKFRRPDRPARWRLQGREKAVGPARESFEKKFVQEFK